MSIMSKSVSLSTKGLECLIVPFVSSTAKLPAALSDINTSLKGYLHAQVKKNALSQEALAITVVPTYGLISTPHLVLVSLGSEPVLNTFRQAAGAAIRSAMSLRADKVGFLCHDTLLKVVSAANMAQTLAEGVSMGSYQFLDHKKPSKTPLQVPKFVYIPGKSDAIRKGSVLGHSTVIARDLANAPANHLTPALFCDRIKALFKSTAVSVKIISNEQAKKMGMNALVAVGQGSSNPPCLAILSYAGSKKAPIALVGKGVTFDSGGISIKPSANMEDMKGDMGGAAAVVGAFWAISQLQPKKHLLGVIPIAENMPSGHATRPGDVIQAKNGTSIEIINTDAEGRLILADALCYAIEQKASAIVDIATLTGACSVALGYEFAGLLGTSDTLKKQIQDASTSTGEAVWELPLHAEFKTYLKSSVADIANASNIRAGGTCTGATFLQQFVGDTPWAHIDMASKMKTTKTSGYDVAGMSGFGARLLATLVL